MRLQIDKQADALYLRLDDSDIIESVVTCLDIWDLAAATQVTAAE